MHEYIFDTPRLRARRIGPADIDALHAVYGDADAMRWVGEGVAITLEQCRQWVEITQRNYATRGYGMFAVEQKPAGNVIGFCGLVHPGGQAEAEIKYAYLRGTWGQGIATEVAAALLRYGHAAHDIRQVIATAAPANVASHRVLLKAGMQRGMLRSNDDGSVTQLFAWTAKPMPVETSIAPLRAVDIPAVAALARAIWREHHVKFVSAGQIEYMLRNKYSAAELAPYVDGTDRWFDVVRVDGTICGFLRCIRKDPAELKLEEIYVSQALRGLGVGSRLLALAESRARELHCSAVVLYVNRANDTAVRAYRHAGFVVRSELVADIGNGYVMDDFLMAKSLDDMPPAPETSGP